MEVSGERRKGRGDPRARDSSPDASKNRLSCSWASEWTLPSITRRSVPQVTLIRRHSVCPLGVSTGRHAGAPSRGTEERWRKGGAVLNTGWAQERLQGFSGLARAADRSNVHRLPLLAPTASHIEQQCCASVPARRNPGGHDRRDPCPALHTPPTDNPQHRQGFFRSREACAPEGLGRAIVAMRFNRSLRTRATATELA